MKKNLCMSWWEWRQVSRPGSGRWRAEVVALFTLISGFDSDQSIRSGTDQDWQPHYQVPLMTRLLCIETSGTPPRHGGWNGTIPMDPPRIQKRKKTLIRTTQFVFIIRWRVPSEETSRCSIRLQQSMGESYYTVRCQY